MGATCNKLAGGVSISLTAVLSCYHIQFEECRRDDWLEQISRTIFSNTLKFASNSSSSKKSSISSSIQHSVDIRDFRVTAQFPWVKAVLAMFASWRVRVALWTAGIEWYMNVSCIRSVRRSCSLNWLASISWRHTSCLVGTRNVPGEHIVLKDSEGAFKTFLFLWAKLQKKIRSSIELERDEGCQGAIEVEGRYRSDEFYTLSPPIVVCLYLEE